MSHFSAVHRRTSIISGLPIYDTAVGNGVDSAGFASLPLSTGGTTGTDVITGSPTSTGASITYTAGTRTLSGTSAGGNNIATWTGILTTGQVYRLQIGIIRKSYVRVHVKDENGNLLWDASGGYDGSGNPQLQFADTTFTAIGHDFILYIDNDSFTTGAEVRLGILAPQTGAIPGHRWYVANGGSDTINPIAALNSATPFATMDQAAALVISGVGDQILVAQGSSFPVGFPLLSTQSGRSAVYPLVFQSYDPADPLNEAKLGRASGSNRPRIGTTMSTPNSVTNVNSTVGYLAFRGFHYDPPDSSDMEVDFLTSSSQSIDYVLIENNVFSHSGVGVDLSNYGTQGQHWIFRNNSMYGIWGSSGHIQQLYVGNVQFLTVEDNVLWHGWKLSASRDDTIANGGLVGDEIFRHTCYLQNTCGGIIYRRNLAVDGNADGGHLLSDVVATENLIIDCPIAFDMPGGVNANILHPSGVDRQLSYNAIIGSADLTSSLPRSFAFNSGNSSSGSSIHHNLAARASNASGSSRVVFTTDTGTTTDYHDNVSYLWSASGGTISTTSGGVATFENNIWDDPSSGSNVNNGSVSFPNAYTLASLMTASGYADKQAFIDYAIANPEAHPQRAVYNFLMAGYGISHSI